MIQKVSAVSVIAKTPVRSNLKNVSGLRVLAGSSMSGWHGPHFVETDMIVPGGLNFAEKAYYLLTKKMPDSVIDRWFADNDSYTPVEGDEVVKMSIGDGIYIGQVLEGPRAVGVDVASDVGAMDTVDIDVTDIASAGEIGVGDLSDGDISDIDLFSGTLMI